MAELPKTKDQENRENPESVETKDLAASEEVIDPRLDNRTGDQRPPLEEFPAKPQQVDGPDVTQKVPRPGTLDTSKGFDGKPRKGMSSPGPHGLGNTEAIPFDEAVETKSDTTKKDSDK